MLGGLARGAMGAAQKYGPTLLENAPGILNAGANVVRAIREQELSAD